MRWIHLMIASSMVAGPAVASDGLLEISQTCAVETGCFPGDSAGFPVTIDETGSYRLTSNLVVPDANTDAIRVFDDNVSIDLNDFAILGPVTCSGTPASCTPTSGTGTGVEAFFPISGTKVHGGSIVGMGASGVVLGPDSDVHDLRVRWNRIDGIAVNNGSAVSRILAVANGNNGIDAGVTVVVSECTASRNGADGIETGANAVVSGSSALGNGASGISVGIGSVVRDSSVRNNSGDGIAALAASTIKNNSSTSNQGDGIWMDLSGTVFENVALGNADFGMRLGFSVAYSQNMVRENTNGTITGGVATGTNLCNGNTTCP
jgi:hypothetical protein